MSPFNLLAAAALLTACGGSTPPADVPAAGGATPEAAAPDGSATPAAPSASSTASDNGAGKAADKGADSEPAALNDDQKAQMEVALRRGNDKAKNCTKVVPGSPGGEGEVRVTFDGKIGKLVDATVGPPFAGTPIESCIKRSFIGEYALRFEGALEVPYPIKLDPSPDVAAANAPKGKGAKGKQPPKKN